MSGDGPSVQPIARPTVTDFPKVPLNTSKSSLFKPTPKRPAESPVANESPSRLQPGNVHWPKVNAHTGIDNGTNKKQRVQAAGQLILLQFRQFKN